MKVVLDTNVWVSGLLLPKSNAGTILKLWYQAKFDIVLSQYILDEIKRVLFYPKIYKRLQWDSHQVGHYIDLLSFYVELVDIKEIKVVVEADHQDSAVLATLIESKAEFLISGDSDLLELKEEYPILSVSQFLEKINS